MAVTGVFTADFSAFDKAVTTSESNLQKLDAGAGKVSSSLRLMTQSQEQMLDNIGAAGGRVVELGTAAGTTSTEVKTLNQSYQQFDGLLQAAGVNIGPQVKGLEDIAAAAGKTSTEIGALGTAGLVAGAFMTGWKIGEFIDKMTGASKVIEAATNAVTGWGAALADQTAGAQLDVINRALALGAKEGITYGDAIKFVAEQTAKNAAASIDWAGKLNAAKVEVNNLSEAQRAEIAVAIEAGATTEQLTLKYGISAQGLEVLAEKQRAAAAATAEHRREQEALDKAYDKLMSDTKNATQLAIMETDAKNQATEANNKKTASQNSLLAAIVKSTEATTNATKFERELIAEQATIDQQNADLTASFTAAGEAAAAGNQIATEGVTQTSAGYAGLTQQVNINADAIRGWIALMQYTNQANAILKENSLFTTSSQLERIGGLSVPSFASGVENFGGGLAKVHGGEVLANLPAGTSVFPRGQGLGATVNNTFNLVDSESNLARRVAELIMRQVRAGTQLGTA